MEQNENDKKQFRCMGDCLNCRAMNDRKIQWQYCAAQHAYNSMMMIKTMQESVETINGTIEELRLKIDAIQNSEAVVFNPLGDNEEEEDTAQEGDGVKE